MTFFEPSPVLLTFIFIQRFVFFEVLALLALLRLLVGRGLARGPALITVLICAAAIFTTFAPAMNLQGVPLYADAARLMASGGGMVLPLLTSAVFSLCWLIPARHWRWIDWLHMVGLAGFIGLWAFTRV